jgi:hypothetical protein
MNLYISRSFAKINNTRIYSTIHDFVFKKENKLKNYYFSILNIYNNNNILFFLIKFIICKS